MSDTPYEVILGSCEDVLKDYTSDCFDSCVTDPPYALEFMGKGWDKVLPSKEVWNEVYRTLKPGGYLLAFGGTRTFHRLVCSIEDAGFEIRDCVMWLYGSGFPKSLDVSKAIDKRGGRPDLAQEIGAAIKQARESRGWTTGQADRHFCGGTTNWTWYEGRKGIFRPPTPDDFARIVEEWPELAPQAEMVAQAEREVVGAGVSGKTYGMGGLRGVETSTGAFDVTAPATPEAERWQGWGTALKPAFEPIVVARKPLAGTVAANVLKHGTGAINVDACRVPTNGEVVPINKLEQWSGFGQKERPDYTPTVNTQGRWPANVIHDGSDEVADRMGDASRFFYCAKSPKKERTVGGQIENRHPTVKPVELIRYLCRMVTQPGGLILDPFVGSGTTIEAGLREGFGVVGIDAWDEAYNTAKERAAIVYGSLGDDTE